jgi:biotin-[acetyl-CoA-carboxylase] ligase BirA-like protein
MSIKILHFAELTSTNDYAIELIGRNYVGHKVDDMAILADTQTAGRGRLNKRVWVSALGNFHCSYVLNIEKLGIQANKASVVNDISVVALRDMLTAITGNVDRIVIKFPNDILVPTTTESGVFPSGKKIAGILVEILYPYAIVGVGLNLLNSPVKTATNIMDEFKILVQPLELVDNLHRFLIDGISSGF